jgi:5'-methylthioadenosine phosphorylase
MTLEKILIGVIGGSGLYHLEGFEVLEEVYPETPWGFPSDHIVICKSPMGHRLAFLARHGRGHYQNPTEVNARANIAALKHLGVEVILSFSAVGSLREEIRPRDFVIPSQLIDRTKGIRPSTFFENGVVGHVGFADPFCPELASMICEQLDNEGITFHQDKTLSNICFLKKSCDGRPCIFN